MPRRKVRHSVQDYKATSGEAYRRARHGMASVKRAILVAINAAMNDGRGGLTTDEFEVLTGIAHQTASARWSELADEGAIEVTGARRTTRTRTPADVYRLAFVARPAARQGPQQGALGL